jgi:hypothetical protein
MSVAAAAAAPATPNPFSPEALVTTALGKLGADAPTADSILRIAADLAVLVNKAPGLHGPEKTALVQRVLRDVVAVPAVRATLSDDAAAALAVVIDTIVPTALTLIVSAGRGEFDLKKVTPAKAWAWCCRTASAVAVAVQQQKGDTASIVKVVGEATADAVSVVVAPEAAPAPAAPAASSSAPTESQNPTPAQ